MVNFSDIDDWFFIKWLSSGRYSFTAYVKNEMDENDDIDSDVSDAILDDINLPYDFWKAVWILALIVLAFRVLSIFVLKIKSKKF